MKTGTREAMVLSEVLRTNACMVDHYNLYLNTCQDQQLRSILERQQRHTLDSFQRMVQMMQSHGMDTSRIPIPTALTMGTGSQSTQFSTGAQMTAQPYGTGQYASGSMYTTGTTGMAASMNPQMAGQTGMQTSAINDKMIAEGALLFHKCSADTNTRAALESSEPHLRNALTNMARNCIEMSYEVYNYMTQRGWYQLPETPQNFISHSATQQHSPPQ
ncbi:spore coat protein [Desulfotruncus alcoholivorax]|uniref:spore coat protein n=1 Tax=Desulfotruncus alcoholivorax TaxID=265477 RepID=UPI000412666F|nr:spore coat protein [Desulfotruncus alcoholivorax]